MIVKKIAMVGSYGVGKTSLVRRFVESLFDDQYLTTVGVKVDKKQLRVEGKEVTLMIWDLAGEDTFTALRMAYLRGAAAYLLVMDGCRRSTLEKAAELRQRIELEYGAVPFLAVINKADLSTAWEFQAEEARQRGWQVIQTSAKSGDGVEDMFASVAAMALGLSDD